MSTMQQYETYEWTFPGTEGDGLSAEIWNGQEHFSIKGFYAGDGQCKLRFFPERAGEYHYQFSGVSAEEGTIRCSAASARHGMVRAKGTHFCCSDGSWFYPFGTTVYALVHQSEALINETLHTLSEAPFNKIRICIFPKDYQYNKNEPQFYPFARRNDGTWDVYSPCRAYWDHLERRIQQLDSMGIQVDLILFHPYDRWGFAKMPMEDNLVYLDYLLRRLSAYPNLWWSLANEYDLCYTKSVEDWETLERFIYDNDPFRHLLSNHNCFKMWDVGRDAVSHASWQTRRLAMTASLLKKYRKPVMIDECRYEGNLPEFWGNISAQDMTQRFWRVTVQGGYCTHGETFLPGTAQAEKATDTGEPDVVWWAKGGKLNGESPARIAFLRKLVDSLPGPLEPLSPSMNDMIGLPDEQMQATLTAAPEDSRGFLKAIAAMDQADRDAFFALEYSYSGHCGEDAYLFYKDDQCCASTVLQLPEDKSYRIEVIDTWEMTRSIAVDRASGSVRIELPGKPYMAVLAVRTDALAGE